MENSNVWFEQIKQAHVDDFDELCNDIQNQARQDARKEVGDVIGEFSDSEDWDMVSPYWRKRLGDLGRVTPPEQSKEAWDNANVEGITMGMTLEEVVDTWLMEGE